MKDDGKVRKGQIVVIDFMDHTQDSDKADRCLVFGRVVRSNKESITIDSWANKRVRDERNPDNLTTFTILRGVIKRIDVLITENVLGQRVDRALATWGIRCGEGDK